MFVKQSHMFFVFTFNTTIALLITYKMSNAYEKLYDHKKSDSEMKSSIQNVDLGDYNILQRLTRNSYMGTIIIFFVFCFVFTVMLLKKESYQLSF